MAILLHQGLRWRPALSVGVRLNAQPCFKELLDISSHSRRPTSVVENKRIYTFMRYRWISLTDGYKHLCHQEHSDKNLVCQSLRGTSAIQLLMRMGANG